MTKRIAPLLLLALAALVLATPAVAADNPCNPCAKNPCNPCAKNPCNPCAKAPAKAMMPAMNPCHAKDGTLFYVNDAMRRDSVTFSSEAPLEDIVGTTNEIAGYIVFDPDKPKSGIKGEIMVPIASLDTGIPLRDEHLHSAMWLNANAYPYATLKIDDSSPRVKTLRSRGEFQTYEATVDGSLTLNGKSRDVEIPARIVFMEESAKTKTKMPGNLLGVRASMNIDLAAFGVDGPPGADLIGTKVGDVIAVEVSLTGSSVLAMAGNPCNPCAKNPCNPCAKNPCAKNPCNPCAKNPCNPCSK